MQPLGYFDPLGFCKMGDEQGFRQLRASELKHGRVAMVAAIGAVVQHFVQFPGFEKAHGTFGALLSSEGVLGSLLLATACGALEYAWREDESREPGNFGDPWGVGMYGLDMRNREISNGRMAMISVLGIFAAELATGRDAIEQFGLWLPAALLAQGPLLSAAALPAAAAAAVVASLRAREEQPLQVPVPAGFRRAEPAGALEPEVLELPAPEGSAAPLGIAVIPGNPGIPQFYCEFGRHLQEAAAASGAGSAAVYIVGYTNFPTASERDEHAASIDEEADRFGPVLARLAARHQEAGLVVVGQSVGAWCVLQQLQARHFANLRVPLVVLATPYLEFDAEGIQQVYRQVFGLPFSQALVSTVGNLIVALPRWAQRHLVPAITGVSTEESSSVVLSTFGSRMQYLDSMINMAKTEFDLLDPGCSANGFAALEAVLPEAERPNLLVLLADTDMWAGPKHIRRLHNMFAPWEHTDGPRSQVVSIGDAQHSFCLVQEQSRRVAGIIATSLAAA